MIAEKKKTLWYIAACAAILILVIVLIAVHGRSPKSEPAAEPVAEPTPVVIVQEKLVERTITAEIIQDGLKDMGVLETQQYFFTEILSASKTKKIFGLALPFTESSYIISYEGAVTAGVDLTKVRIIKNENDSTVTVYLPRAEITSIDIDMDSFQLYSEKNGLGTHFSVSDYNASLAELEKNARESALSHGLTEAADKTAQLVIRNFIGSMIDLNKYTVRFALPEDG